MKKYLFPAATISGGVILHNDLLAHAIPVKSVSGDYISGMTGPMKNLAVYTDDDGKNYTADIQAGIDRNP